MFRATPVGVKTMPIKGEIRFTSEYGKDSWGFPAREQSDRGVDGTRVRGDMKGRRILVKPT